MNSTQLKIRIRLDQSAAHAVSGQGILEQTDQSARSDPDPPVYQYNWPRIIMAALACLLILGAIVWAAAIWLADKDDIEMLSADTFSLPEMPADPESESAALLSSPLPATSPPVQSFGTADVQDNLPAEIITDPPATASVSASEPETSAVPDPLIQPENKPEATVLAENQDTGQGITYPARVLRAQLTSNIRQREPVDNIDHISLAGKPSRRIFLFLHLHKLGDERVTVDWFYRDTRVARVILPIGNDDWRTYSSKILSQNRPGSWRVTASDQSGNLLAEFRFRATH